MILALLALQAAATAVPPAARGSYETFRRCLVEQARSAALGHESDETVLEYIRSKCLFENLASGSAILFAEMDKGATKPQALERGARLREEAEREALARRRDATPPPPPPTD